MVGKKHKTYEKHKQDEVLMLTEDMVRASTIDRYMTPELSEFERGMREMARIFNNLIIKRLSHDNVVGDYDCGDYCGWDTENDRPYPAAKHFDKGIKNVPLADAQLDYLLSLKLDTPEYKTILYAVRKAKDPDKYFKK